MSALHLALAIVTGATSPSYPLTTTDNLVMFGTATIAATTYRGRKCVLVTEDRDPNFGDVALIKGSDFQDGTIEFDVACLKTPYAPRDARGFVGIAFRGTDNMERYENFYFRMTNGRSPDPILRQRAVQYCSVPDYPWHVLRAKHPGRFEAPADIELGAWTHVKISVHRGSAKFYVGDTKKPTLSVSNLLRGNVRGKVGLWVAAYTKGYFSNLRVTPARTGSRGS